MLSLAVADRALTPPLPIRSLRPILCDYFFEEVTQVLFQVLDVDSEVGGVYRGDELGSLETTVAELVTARPNFTRKLMKSSPKARTPPSRCCGPFRCRPASQDTHTSAGCPSCRLLCDQATFGAFFSL